MDTPINQTQPVYPHQSPTLGKLAEALSKAQGAIEHAKKENANSFFNSRYADLAALLTVAKKPLADNGLSVIQTTQIEGDRLVLVTTLAHASGEWISGHYPIDPVKKDPQGFGSACSYARRYALGAIIGIAASEDDDGEGAMGRQPQTPAKPQNASPRPSPSANPKPPAPKPEPKTATTKPEPEKTGKNDPKPLSAAEQMRQSCAKNEIPESFVTEKFREHGYVEAQQQWSDAQDEVIQRALDHFQWFMDQFKKEKA